MTVWDGAGLPPPVQARIDRARASGVRSSLLSVGGQIGIDACGFTAVGEVMGCIVEHIGFQGYGGCGIYGASGYANSFALGGYSIPAPPTLTSGSGNLGGFAPYVDALYRGVDTSISRMLLECRELGGDGIVGVTLEQRHLGEGNREFLALGTAVRAVGNIHPRNPFATTLAGQDVAKLLHSGYVPAAIVVGISVAIRHDDYQTRSAQSMFAPNMEILGFTDLATQVRADARHQLARRTAAVGAEGAVLSSAVSVAIHELEVGENHRDHVAEASMTGTAIASFGARTGAMAPPRMVLPLDSTGPRSRRRARP